MSFHIPSFGSINTVGHKYILDIFDGEVEITEKVDASFYGMAKVNGEYFARSKSQQLISSNPEKLFKKTVENTINLDLKEGYIYYGEAFNSPKHNSLTYERVPANNLIFFAIDKGNQDFLTHEQMTEEGKRIGLETVPLIFRGKINDVEGIKPFLDRKSILGNVNIEGIVIKRFDKFLPDHKIMMGKYVSAEFKEIHTKEWKLSNPTKQDIILHLISEYKTEARWNKALQHLRESGEITDTPKDIGLLLKNSRIDIEKECEVEIKDKLWNHFRDQILRGSVAGIAEWYKAKLLENVNMRFNLLGASGVGKSTTAAWLFSELKRKLISVELTTEYCKHWAYSGRKVNEFDQIYLFGKQLQYEYRFLSNGVKNIVTDSPTLLSMIYAKHYYPHINIWEPIQKINEEYEKRYPSIDILLIRGEKPYIQEGRYQSYDESKKIDLLIKLTLNSTGRLYYEIDYQNRDGILEKVMQHIDK